MYQRYRRHYISSPFYFINIEMVQTYFISSYQNYHRLDIEFKNKNALTTPLLCIIRYPHIKSKKQQKITQTHIKYKKMQSCLSTGRKKYFILLLALQTIITILLIVGGQFSSALGLTIIRIIMLLAANYCLDINFAIFYAVFALYNSLYLIDPIGLFLTAHTKKTVLQNVLCVLAMVFMLIASYLGYLFGKELAVERASGPVDDYNQGYQSFQNEGQFRAVPINQPQRASQQPSTSYGGTNYLYQNPSSNQPQRRTGTGASTTNNQSSSFQPFSGAGYSLS